MCTHASDVGCGFDHATGTGTPRPTNRPIPPIFPPDVALNVTVSVPVSIPLNVPLNVPVVVPVTTPHHTTNRHPSESWDLPVRAPAPATRKTPASAGVTLGRNRRHARPTKPAHRRFPHSRAAVYPRYPVPKSA